MTRWLSAEHTEAESFRKAREDLELTRKKLSQKLGFSMATIANVERGMPPSAAYRTAWNAFMGRSEEAIKPSLIGDPVAESAYRAILENAALLYHRASLRKS